MTSASGLMNGDHQIRSPRPALPFDRSIALTPTSPIHAGIVTTIPTLARPPSAFALRGFSHPESTHLTKFSDFGLAEPILKALEANGYTTPTPIQAQAIPHLLTGRDLLGIAQTGTGKTAAFALPLIHRLMANPKRPGAHACRALVLAPTRELASQIAESFQVYSGDMQLNVQVVFGGVPIARQERALLRGVDVLVATPGRLLDLIERRSCRLDQVEALVLDEADQMLDLGFIHALRQIAKLVPKARQSLFFSATMPQTIASLADSYLNDPIKVAVAPVAATVDRVEQVVYFSESRVKQALLEHLLSDPEFNRVIVFTRTKHGADRVVKNLGRAGIEAAAIHGNKSQPQRERALAAFRDGHIGVLVATDIAARGIDIDGVSHVVNFELPNVPESYVHRIGRTARAGAGGSAVSFCNGEERAYLKSIERLTRRTIPQLPIPKSVHSRADELAKTAKTSMDDDWVPSSEGRHHAGRPSDGRRGGERQGFGAKNQPRSQGPRGPRGPREEFRARDEAAPVAAKPMRDTRHGDRIGGRAAPDAPRGDDRRSAAPRDDRRPAASDDRRPAPAVREAARRDDRGGAETLGRNGPRGPRGPRSEGNAGKSTSRVQIRGEGRGNSDRGPRRGAPK